MDEYIQLLNGVVFNNSYLIESNEMLYVYVQDEERTMKKVFDALNDPINTQTITHWQSDEVRQYNGFTHLIAVREENEQMITAVLRHPR